MMTIKVALARCLVLPLLWLCVACTPTLHLSAASIPRADVQRIEATFVAAGWRVERMNPRFFPAKDRRQPLLIAGETDMLPELLLLLNLAGVPVPHTAVHTRLSHRYSSGHAGLYFPPADERNPELMSFVGVCGAYALDMVFREAGDGLLIWSDWDRKKEIWMPRGAEALQWRRSDAGFEVSDGTAVVIRMTPRNGWPMDDHYLLLRADLPEGCNAQPLRTAF